jgi:hypothetical protein
MTIIVLKLLRWGEYEYTNPPKFEAKSADPTMVLSKLDPLKALLCLWSHNPGSELNCTQNPQAEPKYWINPQSAVLIRSANPCKNIRQIQNPNNSFVGIRRPPPLSVRCLDRLFYQTQHDVDEDVKMARQVGFLLSV